MKPLALLLLLAVPPVPGRVDPTVTREQLCSESTRLRRHVTQAMRRAVYVRDGADGGAALFETDHLVPLELGGANTPDNLWAEPWPDAHLKDKRENALHRAACRGEVELAAAQAEMMAWGRDAGPQDGQPCGDARYLGVWVHRRGLLWCEGGPVDAGNP